MAKVATADTMVSAKKDAPMAGDSITSPTNHSTLSMSLLYSLLRVLVRLAFRPKSSKLQSKTTLFTYLQFRLRMKVNACFYAFAMPAKRLICNTAMVCMMLKRTQHLQMCDFVKPVSQSVSQSVQVIWHVALI